jgi:hypothetical protein
MKNIFAKVFILQAERWIKTLGYCLDCFTLLSREETMAMFALQLRRNPDNITNLLDYN